MLQMEYSSGSNLRHRYSTIGALEATSSLMKWRKFSAIYAFLASGFWECVKFKLTIYFLNELWNLIISELLQRITFSWLSKQIIGKQHL